MNKVLVIGGVIVTVIVIASGAFFIMSATSKKQAPAVQKPLMVPAITNQKPPPSEVLPEAKAVVNQIKLVVQSPVDKSVVTTPNIKVVGQTVPNAEVAVNEVDTVANAAGNFTVNLTLSEGENPIVIDVFDADGNTSESIITVTYQIPGQ